MCLIWAIVQYRIFKRAYGEERVVLQCRRSKYLKVPLMPHFHVGLVQNDGTVRIWSYKPAHAKPRWLPPPWFHGYVSEGN
jgi:dipeptidyl aminopeptidase/acylaminoacyl peptidase